MTKTHKIKGHLAPLIVIHYLITDAHSWRKKNHTEFANGSEPTTRILIMTNAYYTDYIVFYVEPTSEFQSPFRIVVNFMPNLGVGISGV